MKNCLHLSKTENGRKQNWFAELNGSTITFSWGMDRGAMQSLINEIKSGKNIGKKNETTKEQQAIVELRATANKKIQNGYLIISSSGICSTIQLEDERTCPKPMLANEFVKHSTKIKKGETVYLQPKYDGIRCLANLKTGKLFSRKGKLINSLPHIEKDIKELGYLLEAEWLDGELYSHSLSFQEITSYVRKTVNIGGDSSAIKFMTYDFISSKAYGHRHAELSTIIGGIERLSLLLAPLEKVIWPCKEAIEEAHDRFVDEGYEGLMVRRDLAYQNKRTDSLLKYKKFFQEEYTIVGMEQEEFAETVGAFVLVDSSGKTFKARPAMTAEARKALWDTRESFDYENQVGSVKFQELTDEGIPRFPTFVGVRSKDDN